MEEFLAKALEQGGLFAITMVVLIRLDQRMQQLIDRVDRLIESGRYIADRVERNTQAR